MCFRSPSTKRFLTLTLGWTGEVCSTTEVRRLNRYAILSKTKRLRYRVSEMTNVCTPPAGVWFEVSQRRCREWRSPGNSGLLTARRLLLRCPECLQVAQQDLRPRGRCDQREHLHVWGTRSSSFASCCLSQLRPDALMRNHGLRPLGRFPLLLGCFRLLEKLFVLVTYRTNPILNNCRIQAPMFDIFSSHVTCM